MGLTDTSAVLSKLLAEEKYAALLKQLRPSDDELLFVPQAGARSKLRLLQLDGGRDAKYIVIARNDSALDIAQPLIETIGFARTVEGIEIIYDMTAEIMQGKARPFACDLTGLKARVYALLLVQIEAISVNVRYHKEHLMFRCGFLDASGSRMRAALPFEATVISAAGNQRAHFFGCTDGSDGSAARNLSITSLKLGGQFQVVVRSLLTGNDQRVTIENP